MKTFLTSLPAIVLLALSAHAQNPNVLTNGSFETPVIPGNSYLYSFTTGFNVPGWTFGPSTGLISPPSGFSAPAAPDGSQVAFLQGASAEIGQSVMLPSDGGYVLTYQVAGRPAGGSHGGNVTYSVLLDTSTLVTNATTISDQPFTPQTVFFTSAAGPHVLLFTNSPTMPGDNTAFFDLIDLMPTNSLPDLTVTNLSWTGTPMPNQSLTVSWSVTNIGLSSVSGGWQETLVLSSNLTSSGAVTGGTFNFQSSGNLATNTGYTTSHTVTLPNVQAGLYYLITTVDSLNSVPELNKSNNIVEIPITLVLPDLAPISVSWSGQPVAGQSLTLNMVVTNQGSGSILNSGWHDEWLLCSNASPASVVPGGAFDNYCYCSRSVPTNGSYLVSNGVILPDVPAGTYYLIGVPNNQDNVFESNYANNTSPGVQITVGIPDLAPISVSWSGQPVAGQSLTLNMVVTNQGSGSILNSGWHDEWLLCSNASPASVVPGGAFDNYCYCSRSVPTNGSYLVSNGVILPDVPAGTYYLIGVPNNQDNVFESNYANNTSPGLQITVGIPDLAPISVSWSGQPVAGQSLTLNMVVTNQGSGSILNSGWHDEWLLCSNASPASVVPGGAFDNYCYCSRSVPTNGSYLVSNGVILPDVPAGTYYLIGVPNNQDNVFESNYANNTSPGVQITVGIPDLAPISVSWSGQPVAGQSLTLNMVVTNQGSGSILNSGWHDEWLLCSNASPASVVPGGAFDNYCYCSRSVPTNGSYLVSNGVILPDVPAGTYYLIGVPNNQDNVFESNYANNTSPGVQITVGIPDLAPISVSWSGQPVAGQSLTLNMVVTNQGSGSILNSGWHDEWLLCSNASPASVVPGGAFDNYCYCSRSVPTNGSYLVSNGVILPDVPAGTYYLIGVPNNQDNVFESNYANNTSPGVQITIGNTDLVVTNLSLGSTAVAGMNLTVSFDVFNIATNAYSSYWYDGVTLSTNPTLAGAIASWDWYGYHSIASGGSYVQNQTIPLPGVVAGTNYYLIAQADDRDNVPEVNKSNNLHVLQIAITNLPPTVFLIAPLDNLQTTSCVPVSFTLSADVQLGSYAITNVQFYDGPTAIGQSTSAPYTLQSPLLDHGPHSITVQAADQFGLMATSTMPATVSVNWPSQVNVLRADLFDTNCVVCMTALHGSNYVVQIATNLQPPVDWQPLLTNEISGTILVVTNQRTLPFEFYRTKQLQ